jgi:hypothetical protein
MGLNLSLHKIVLRIRSVFLIIFLLGSILTAVGLFSRPAHAQTWVEGHITQDTTWTIADSPYRAIGNVIVDPGVLLNIEPGVEVQFADGFSLTIEGTLHAIGSPDSPIILTSSRTDPTSGSWNTVRFCGGETESLVLKYCTISYATVGVSITTQYGESLIEQCQIHHNSEGVKLHWTRDGGWAGNAIIKESLVEQNLVGLSLSDGTHDVSIFSNNITRNNENGVKFGEDLSNITLDSNTISNNGQDGVDLGYDVNNFTFSFNTIAFNGKNGVYLWGGASNTSFSSNFITSNAETGIKLDGGGGSLQNMEFFSNTVSSNGENGIYVHVDGYHGTLDEISISDNKIHGNGQKGIWINVGSANYPTGKITINNNSISLNEYGIFYRLFTKEDNIAAFNDIYGNVNGVTITGWGSVIVENNYWGETTGPYHESLNPEGEGNPVNGDGTNLDFIPFLTSPIGTINQRPIANLGIDKTTVNANETVTFDASASTDDGRIDYYFFDFGDGTNSSWVPLSVVTHTYSSDGNYSATLSVMDDFGVTSLDGEPISVEITVIPEFPAFLILPLFMIATLLAIIFYRKLDKKKC